MRRWNAFLVVAALVLTGFAACKYSPTVHPGTLECKDDHGCPSGYRCVGVTVERSGFCCNNPDPTLCVPPPQSPTDASGESPADAPAIAGGDGSGSPELGNANDVSAERQAADVNSTDGAGTQSHDSNLAGLDAAGGSAGTGGTTGTGDAGSVDVPVATGGVGGSDGPIGTGGASITDGPMPKDGPNAIDAPVTTGGAGGDGVGGASGSAGATASGGTSGSGGTTNAGGTATGGAATGGTSSGGTPTGGTSTGGTSSGGTPTGGTTTGGTSTGGSPTVGTTNVGGTPTGGTTTGGTSSGGTPTGGTSTGGTSSGGTSTGGAGGVGGAGGTTAVCQEGATKCLSSISVQTCASGQWGTAVDCGPHQTCTGPDGMAQCACQTDPVCSVGGATCASGLLAICGQDAQGCFHESSPRSTCNNGACTGAAGSASCCLNECTGGTSCLSSTSLQTCDPGGNGCTVASTSDCSSGLVCERSPPATCADPNWAEWPMPNSQVDVDAGAPNLQKYDNNNNGTVTDKVTGLMWQQGASATGVTWSAALNTYCPTLTLADYRDWRLPSVVELISIVDVQQIPTLDSRYFLNTPTDYLWSSSPRAGSPSHAWTVSSFTGKAGDYDIGTPCRVRCVR